MDDKRRYPLTVLAAAVDSAGDPVTRLAAVRELSTRVADVAEEAVREARSSAVPWRVIGESLGVSKQAAAKRYADTPSPHPATKRAHPAGSSEGGQTSATFPVTATQADTGSGARRDRRVWDVRTPAGRLLLRVERGR